MTEGTLRIEGRLYLRLEVVAEIYRVETTWLREAYDQGLLGSGVPAGPTVAISARHLDRVATIVRMHQVLEFDLDTIAVQLAEHPGD